MSTPQGPPHNPQEPLTTSSTNTTRNPPRTSSILVSDPPPPSTAPDTAVPAETFTVPFSVGSASPTTTATSAPASPTIDSKSSDTALVSQSVALPNQTDAPVGIGNDTGSLGHATPVAPIVGGALGGLLVLLLAGLILWRRRRRRIERRIERTTLLSPTSPIGEIRSASTLALDRPAPAAVIESQAVMLEKANAFLTSSASSGPRPPAASESEGLLGSSSSIPVMEIQVRAMAERLALVEAALTARGEDLPPNYTPGQSGYIVVFQWGLRREGASVGRPQSLGRAAPEGWIHGLNQEVQRLLHRSQNIGQY
ncbi:hypothetical protein FB45DRAFT_1029137 [Roridomyces roridus]|uniref:Uncharacterized protein n=1 Tax=Roridomyces roridus TaxID=1738132 RepID=A0AAD7FNN2_9AGAR|nr:hypothetical protein FB45DRAFT_1029137 [Roridomyces roridus]